MKKTTLLVAGLLGLAVQAGAQSPQVPTQQQIINLSLIEALVAIDATKLSGVFAFVPREQSSMAMADYLMHDRKALKKFVKKGERDFKQVQGINEWDREVYLYLVGINSGRFLPAGVERVPKKWLKRIHRMSLARPLPLQVIAQRRKVSR